MDPVERVVPEHVELNGDQLELSVHPLTIGSTLEVQFHFTPEHDDAKF
jgi:hypothetical protein